MVPKYVLRQQPNPLSALQPSTASCQHLQGPQESDAAIHEAVPTLLDAMLQVVLLLLSGCQAIYFQRSPNTGLVVLHLKPVSKKHTSRQTSSCWCRKGSWDWVRYSSSSSSERSSSGFTDDSSGTRCRISTTSRATKAGGFAAAELQPLLAANSGCRGPTRSTSWPAFTVNSSSSSQRCQVGTTEWLVCGVQAAGKLAMDMQHVNVQPLLPLCCCAGERGIGGSKCGATAVNAVLFSGQGGSTQLATANVGDARIILIRGGKAVLLTEEHVPDL